MVVSCGYVDFFCSEAFMELQMTQFFLGGKQNPLVWFAGIGGRPVGMEELKLNIGSGLGPRALAGLICHH